MPPLPPSDPSNSPIVPLQSASQTGHGERNEAGHAGTPGRDLLTNLYQHLPVLVVHMKSDGTVLHCNPETVRVTGYAEGELVGKNFWAVLFPGRLFAQVPKFISAIHPVQALAKDVAMTLRTKAGQERTVAFSRFVHETGGGSEAGRSVVCIGNDLTDRLLDSDKGNQLNAEPAGVGNVVEGDVVTPLAITPPAPPATPGENVTAAIQQVHEFLTQVDTRVEALEKAFSDGEMESVAKIAAGLSSGAHACGLLSFSTRAESLRMAATSGMVTQMVTLVEEIVGICRGGKV